MEPCRAGRAPRWSPTEARAPTSAEHTLGAYVAALDEGADGLECDVRLTADGHLVCVHDRRVDRVTNSHGAGVDDDAGRARRAGLRRPGRTRGPTSTTRRPERRRGQRRVLTLRRLLETVARLRPARRPGHRDQAPDPVRRAGRAPARRPARRVRLGRRRTRPARVMSFSPVALTRVEQLAPDLEVVLLIDERLLLAAHARRARPRLDRRARDRAAPGEPAARRVDCGATDDDPCLDGQHGRRPRPVRRPRGRGGDHRQAGRLPWLT